MRRAMSGWSHAPTAYIYEDSFAPRRRPWAEGPMPGWSQAPMAYDGEIPFAPGRRTRQKDGGTWRPVGTVRWLQVAGQTTHVVVAAVLHAANLASGTVRPRWLDPSLMAMLMVYGGLAWGTGSHNYRKIRHQDGVWNIIHVRGENPCSGLCCSSSTAGELASLSC